MSEFNYIEYLRKNTLLTEDRKAKEYIQSIEDEDEREEERKRMFDDPNDELVEEKDFKLNYSDDLMKIESEYLSDGDKLNDIIDTYENHIKMLRSIISREEQKGNLNEDDNTEDYMKSMPGKYPGYANSTPRSISALYKEKQMVMQQLLGNMQQIASENREELTRDFLLKLKEVIDELMITDF